MSHPIATHDHESEYPEDEMSTAVAKHEPRQPQQAITPMEMLQRAVEQNADLDRLQQLMDLQERWQANQAKQAFTRAMMEFKVNPPTVIKNRAVNIPGGAAYKHADLAQACRAIGEGLSRVGISHRWSVKQDAELITVACILTHVDGHSESVTMVAPPDRSGKKNPVQEIASTVTYLERYTLMAVTGVAAQSDDDAGGPVQPITEKQLSTLLDMIEATGADRDKFLKFCGVDDLAELPATQYRRALAALNAKQQKAKESAT